MSLIEVVVVCTGRKLVANTSRLCVSAILVLVIVGLDLLTRDFVSLCAAFTFQG